VWSYSFYDFPGPAGARTDRFFYRVPLDRPDSSGHIGRFYSPFGSPDIPAYDKYVETADEQFTRNALLDAFGDGVGISYPLGRIEAQFAVQDLATQEDDKVDLFARLEWRRMDWFLGASLYTETGNESARKDAQAIHATFRTPRYQAFGEYLWGRPLGERTKAAYLGARGDFGRWYAFGSLTDYQPKDGASGRTRKIGVGYHVDPLTTVSLWHENNLQTTDRMTLSFSTSLR
jgi:hypothetical protein